jgi:4a-hydroxytetrahydrobiopterin dehydratase
MGILSSDQLIAKRCQACEGGVAKIAGPQAVEQLSELPAWRLDESETSISRKVKCGNFIDAMQVLQKVAEVAEQEQHHPDLHLTGYRHVRIDLTTHAIGGLSENDFILAAKIDKILS